MNREIKFRVWIEEDKRFIYSDKCPNDNLSRLYEFFYDVNYCRGRLNHPDKVILQQYTGLKDKNGKEIYEGDIVSGNDYAVPYDKCVVKFFNGSFLLIQQYKNKNLQIQDAIVGDFHIPGLELEVIGNIYENPELLK